MTPEVEIRRYLDRDALVTGATIITVNRRLSRRLQQLWGELAHSSGEVAWETPDILPWNAWLQRSWESMLMQSASADRALPATLLDAGQELALWERVIGESTAGRDLLRPAAAAREVREAHALVHAWRLRLSDVAQAGDDVDAFLGWSRQYQSLCRRAGWTDEARLPDLLAADPEPAVLHLVGFAEYTPQQQALFAAIVAAGGQVTHAAAPATGSPARSAASVQRVACRDAAAEIEAAARRARALLEDDPAVRIGIVVPDLVARRAEVARVFADVFDPPAVLPGVSAGTPLYNLSAGLPLAQTPIVHDALRILQLAHGECPLETVGALLRSPFIAGAEQERDARALLDVRLRRNRDGVITLRRLVTEAGSERVARQHPARHCPLLAERLTQIQSRHGSLRDRRLRPSAWAETLLGLLGQLGWPGERGLDSEEHQAVEAWRELVSGLSLLDVVLPRLDLTQVLARLQRLADERMFQPERADAPVQVLGLLEADGLAFDHLRIIGLHDEAWPPAPDPNPFLPLALQRVHNLPHASAARQLEVAQGLLDRLLAAAPEVRLSHPLHEGDRELLASPLIVERPLVEETETGAGPLSTPCYRDQLHAARGDAGPETIDDSRGPAITGDQAGGGSQLFKWQAACPFSAFARFRLACRPLEEAATGLDAAERGKLLHRVLERVWHELGDWRTLEAIDDAATAAMLERITDAVLAEAADHRPQTFTRHFRAIEGQRLVRQVGAWLDVERARAPFVVEHLELPARAVAGGVGVDVVIDRIDRLEQGGRVILDYKTGEAAPAMWHGERPEDPQLPLYSLQVDDLRAVLFARIRAGDINCVGVARDDGIVHSITAEDDWDALLGDWRSVLERLGGEFRAGHATVDPKSPSSTCRHCGLTALCRIHESTSPVADDIPLAAEEDE